VTNIDTTGAQLNGGVIKSGTAQVLDFGFLYVEKPSNIYKTVPDTFSVSLGTHLEENFSIRIDRNLNKNLNYYVMAYVVTAKETAIGNSVIFKSQSTSPIRITSFSPASVLDGDTLTIFGENFNRYGADYVYIGNQLLINALRYNNKLVTVTVPPISQPGQVNVTVDAFYSKTNSDQLIIIAPSIISFSPTHGPSGQAITISGRFSNDINYNKVFFNGVESTISRSSKSQMIVNVPTGLSGNVSITIDVNGKTFTATDPFFVE